MTRVRAAAARKEAAALLKRLDDALLVTVGGPELIAEFKLLKVEVEKSQFGQW